MDLLKRCLIVCLALAGLLAGSPAMARNVAMVIGNSAYATANVLSNPINDARIVAAGARRAGFEVIERNDLGKPAFDRALRDFLQLANGADVAMIYYAGHGIEAQGKNWLIPTDARLDADFDLPYEAVELDRLLEALSGARVRMVVLDACRNNPFGANWRRGFRAVPSGLAQFETDDFLVIYAAAPGQLATDGAGSNSPFALSLARRLPEPGLPVQLLGGKVRDDVMGATGGTQRPYTSGSITGTPIFLVPAPVAAPIAPPVAAPSSDRATTEALLWQGAASADSAGAYQAYLREFPGGIFARLARERIAALQVAAQPAFVTAPAPIAAPAPVIAAPAPAPQLAVAPPPAIAAAAPGPAPALVLAAPAPVAAETPGPAPVAIAAPAPIAPPLAQDAAQPGAALAFPQSSPQSGAPGSAATLPLMPATPRFPAGGYPACREDYQAIADGLAKVAAINHCTTALDAYFQGTLTGYRATMADHQNAISRLYIEKVGGTGRFEPNLQDQFYRAMMREHADSQPEGAHFADYRAAETRYREDRAYLEDRYCFMTGCKGYPGQTFYKPVPLGKDGKPLRP